MAITKFLLQRKAKGIIDSIDKMRDRERAEDPSESFAHDYNNLRSQILKLRPDLEQILPPSVRLELDRDNRRQYCVHRYHEILIFCNQLFELLQDDPDSPNASTPA